MARTNSYLVAIRAGLACILALALVPSGGCTGCNREWKTVRIRKGSQTCRVVVYSPPYGKNARPPDAVTVAWDGEEVFSGVLPTRTSGPDGMPVDLLEIICDPGAHVLEVKTGAASQKQNVNLKNQETRHYKIFGIKDGNETLIEDLGNSPRFL